MPRVLTNPLLVASNAMMSMKALRMFIEIPMRSQVDGYFRLVGSTRHATASGKIWQACSFKITLPDEDVDGTMGEVSVEIPNISRIPMAYLEEYGEFKGQTLRAWLGLEGQDLVDALSWRAVILRVPARERKITLVCGHPPEHLQVPSVVYSRLNFRALLPQGGITQ